MKIGMRKPNLKKSIKARTTGKLKRKVKKATNPFYGKKGVGYIKDPKKALYNKVYNKTTFGVGDLINSSTKGSNKQEVVYSKQKPQPETMVVSLQELLDCRDFDTLRKAKKQYFWKIWACVFYGMFLIVPLFFIPKNVKIYKAIKQALKGEEEC